MASSSQYRSDRRVTAVKAVNSVRGDDVTVKDDLQLRGKFRKALERAADSLRAEQQRREHQTFADADARHGGHADSGQHQRQERGEPTPAVEAPEQDVRERKTAPVDDAFEAHPGDLGGGPPFTR